MNAVTKFTVCSTEKSNIPQRSLGCWLIPAFKIDDNLSC